MKSRLLIIIGMVGLSLIINSQQVDGLCMINEDWPNAPCWGKRCTDKDVPQCTDSNWWKEKWAPYYDYKGKEWMEMKNIELLDAIATNKLVEWKRLTPNGAHGNVYDYYFYMGEIPNSEGMFVDQIFSESFPPHDPYSDDERLRLASEKKSMSEETMGFGSGIGFFDESNFQLITIIIAILIGTGSGIGLTLYWRNRK